jgi:putative heme-binding domain-containing protein
VRIALNCPSADVVRDALGVLRSVPPSAAQHAKILDEVKEYRDRRNRPLAPELAYALRATAPVGALLPDDAAKAAIRDTGRDAPGPLRSAAADLLTRAALSADALVSLAGVLPGVSPLELPKLLGAFARSTDTKVGLALVKALSDPAVRSVVRAETVKPILDKYPKPVRDEAEKLYALLAEATKGEREKLDKLLASLEPGDIRRGQAVFNGAKGQCVACHKIGYVGGLVGPDLTRIGGIRTERDLLEAIVFPNASFVRSYEPVRVVTADGRTLNGVLKKDAPDEIILAVAADKEERIARADVESINPSSVSVMPAGLDQQLTPRELADLVAFLRACK